jgi:Protein of unknown function (DUF993)
MATVNLPGPDGRPQPFELSPPAPPPPAAPPRFDRIAYAAAHIVAQPPGSGAPRDPRDPGAVDWEATLRFREHLWRLGFGIAEAMDTAQREVLGWENAARLLAMTLAAAKAVPGRLVLGGAGTDHLATATPSLTQLIDAYVLQAETIHAQGGRAILFPTAHLPARFPQPEHYVTVYRAVSEQVSRPVFVHWLGEMFAPALAGYFPQDSFWRIMADNPKLLGVKVSLLEQAREEEMRRRLGRQGQVVLTGDDFNYPPLILGTPKPLAEGALEFEGRTYPLGDHSHALLGIFDGIAPVASRALAALAAGDAAACERLLAPTVPLARKVFGAPTRFYKAGLVLLAYLNGHQAHFHLLEDLERERDPQHCVELFKLADRAGALADPAAACERLQPLLAAWAHGA